MVLFCEHGINWDWWIDATINPDNTATIHKHYRLHRSDDYQGAAQNRANHDVKGGFGELREKSRLRPGGFTDYDAPRIVDSLYTGGIAYPVTNPRGPFDYN